MSEWCSNGGGHFALKFDGECVCCTNSRTAITVLNSDVGWI